MRRTRPCGGSHSIPALSSPFDPDLTPYTRNLARRLSAGYETASSSEPGHDPLWEHLAPRPHELGELIGLDLGEPVVSLSIVLLADRVAVGGVDRVRGQQVEVDMCLARLDRGDGGIAAISSA